jgi:TolB-like protein
MADVFISYAHTTSKQARAAAAALRAVGYSVWLDDDLAVHRAFTQAIEEQLTAAKAALVIWSADAARSEWVLSEANRAREDRKLVQLIIDRTRLPMPFDQVQCADLSGWTGEGEHPNWRRVTASIRELVGGARSDAANGDPHHGHGPRPAELALAVLAFDNLSGDPEMAFFSDGVSAEIQQAVARSSELKVIARSSSFQFRGADKAPRKVAAGLNVTHVLDGSVRRGGAKVRVAAELVRCDDEASIWSERFDRDLTDMFELQDEIAGQVAAALKVALAPAKPAGAVDAEAYDLFLKVEAKWGQSADPADDLEIHWTLEHITETAPAFAPAWARLALSYVRQGRMFGSVPYAEAKAAAQVAAETALRLDPKAGVARIALAGLLPRGRYAERERLLAQARDDSPNERSCFWSWGDFLDQVGRNRESLLAMRRAYELDPLWPLSVFRLSDALYRVGAYEDYQKLNADGRRRWPKHPAFYSPVAAAAAYAQDWKLYDEIMAAADAAGLEGPDLQQLAEFADAYRGRNPGYVEQLLAGLRLEVERQGWPTLSGLLSAVKLGHAEEAFALVAEATYPNFEENSPNPGGFYTPAVIFGRLVSPEMLNDVRFVGLCAKLGLCDYWVETGHWPDCADFVSYDFRAEALRLAGSA